MSLRLDDHDLVIWDCDGVLVDSETLTVDVERRLLAELGWELTTEEVVAAFMGRSLAAELADVAERLGPAAAARFEAALLPALEEAFARDLRPVPGVVDVLAALTRAGVPMCVASSGTPEGIRTRLRLTGITAFGADRLFSAVQVVQGKPAPDLFLLAARTLGAAPERCVVVEDSVHGVTAAGAAGMSVLGYAGGLATASALRAAGARTFARMADLVVGQSERGP